MESFFAGKLENLIPDEGAAVEVKETAAEVEKESEVIAESNMEITIEEEVAEEQREEVTVLENVLEEKMEVSELLADADEASTPTQLHREDEVNKEAEGLTGKDGLRK